MSNKNPAKGSGGLATKSTVAEGSDGPATKSTVAEGSDGPATKRTVPKDRQDLLKWNGWGYKDSQFVVHEGMIHFTGRRYPIENVALPYFTEWVCNVFDIDLKKKITMQEVPSEDDLPTPMIGATFKNEFEKLKIPFSVTGIDRIVRSHGHTLHDMYSLREGDYGRIPDIVVWPDSHDSVVKIVDLANQYDVVIIPFGGGTSVTGAVNCPRFENRTIISLDTSQMNQILWVDTDNFIVCCEAGIIGQDLERELRERGFTTGHEPDSYEFSTLGGWVATRASGMKKNTYGNIEDLVVHVRMVTPSGVLEKTSQVPRISCGPDFNHVILGSEGTLGVITQVSLKIHPLPACKKFGSIIFRNFEDGVKYLREIAHRKCQPSSVRLMDNEQFKFGETMRQANGFFGTLLDNLKMVYITKIKRFDPNKMCVATLVFEGDYNDVELQEKKVYSIAAQFNGIATGERNGKRGYMMTFLIAYIRDLGLDYGVVAESFETSVNWDRALSLCNNVKHRVAQDCEQLGINKFWISCRVTQTYDVGCCIYFYFGFNATGIEDPLGTYEALENRARHEILCSGGSISHHHGVGKIRAKWYPKQITELGVYLYKATKINLDPNNIFANGNFLNNCHL